MQCVIYSALEASVDHIIAQKVDTRQGKLVDTRRKLRWTNFLCLGQFSASQADQLANTHHHLLDHFRSYYHHCLNCNAIKYEEKQ